MNNLKDKTQAAGSKVKVAYCKLANLKLTTYVIVKQS